LDSFGDYYDLFLFNANKMKHDLNDQQDPLQALTEFLKSPEGKASIAAFAQELVNKDNIKASQLARFNERLEKGTLEFASVVERVLEKYNSDKYRDHWYKAGYEPPEPLCFFLFYYAEKYGRECTKKEWKKFANMFTGDLYYYGGYYFNLMHGQGSVVHITHENDEK